MSEAQLPASFDEDISLAIANVDEMVVDSQPKLDFATGFLRNVVKPLIKEVNDTFDPIAKKAHDAHKEVVAQRKKKLEPLVQMEKIVKSKIGIYIETERARIAAEQKKLDEEEALAEAVRMEKAGATPEAVDTVLTTHVAAPVAPAPITDGVSTSKRYSAEVVNLGALVMAVAEGKAPPDVLVPNQTRLNQMAVALRGMMKIPGVRVVEKSSVTVRG